MVYFNTLIAHFTLHPGIGDFIAVEFWKNEMKSSKESKQAPKLFKKFKYVEASKANYVDSSKVTRRYSIWLACHPYSWSGNEIDALIHCLHRL